MTTAPLRLLVCRRVLSNLVATASIWLAVGHAAAAEPPSEGARSPWYYTEVVIFQRPRILEHAGDEVLVRSRGASLPRQLLLMHGDRTPERHWPLQGTTRACLSFPMLTLLPPPGDGGATPQGQPPPTIEPYLQADPLLDYLRALRRFEDDLAAQSHRWLAKDTFTLAPQAQRLTRSGGYQVLLHGRWLQAVPPRESPQPLLIQAGPQLGDGYALEGAIGVTLGRFLHFEAELTYREPLLGQSPVDHAFATDDGTPAGLRAVPQRTLTPADLQPDGYLLVQESRRMRSGELHYIDHPKLGILVRSEPVSVPESLSAARLALEESQ
jgi:hypothetical protein